MRFNRTGRSIIGGINTAACSLNSISSVALGVMVLIVFANVLGRFLFKAPLMGTIELVELMMVIIAVFAMSYTAVKYAHVRVNLLVGRFSRRTQSVLGTITLLLCIGILGIITYQSIINTIPYINNLDNATSTLSIPYAPFRVLLALGFVLLLLTLLAQIIQPLPPEGDKKGEDCNI